MTGTQSLEQAENYPGELNALRSVMSELRSTIRFGTLVDVNRVMNDFDRQESDAHAALPWRPQKWEVYAVPLADGEDRHALVLDEGLWRRKPVKGEPRVVFARSSLRHETPGDPLRDKVNGSLGYLVLMTSGGRVLGHRAEKEALRAFPAFEIPETVPRMQEALESVATRARPLGLVLTVRPSKDFKELEGESRS